MKNKIYIAVVVVCLLVAVVVFVKTRSGGPTGIESIPESEMTWLLCTNTACGASYEMSLREFSKQLESKAQAGRMPMNAAPMLTCQKCGKDSIVKAIKCEKCGNVFREYSVPADFADRCPKCKFSKTEAERKARAASRTQ